MHCSTYESIDDIGADRIAPLRGSPVDFSYGLLRALERTLWGDLEVRYLCVEEGGTLLSFVPVSVGTNIAFTAVMPRPIQTGYRALVDGLGLSAAYRVAVAGSLISDRGFIPLLPECDSNAVIGRLLEGLDALAREEKARVCFLKDIHQDFPAIGRVRAGGFVECHSLPTVRIDTHFRSTNEYIESLSPNGRSHARRTLRKIGKNFTVRVVTDYASLIPEVYPLFRATYLKAQFKLEELPPRFFAECCGAETPRSEMILCEKGSRIVGAYLVFYTAEQQLNKRVGIDYAEEDSAAIYNVLNYQCILRAVERGIPLSYLGQTTYTPKVRMGGRLEDQFLFIKGYDAGVRASLPLQKAWLRRYRAERAYREMGGASEKGEGPSVKEPPGEASAERTTGGSSKSGAAVMAPSGARWKVLLVTSLGVFMVSLDTTIVNVAFPAIKSAFPSATQVDLSWVLNAYFIVFAALLVSAGRVADLMGRRRIFFLGLAIFTVSSALCGLAPTALALIGARALQAVGAAALIPASLALLLPAFEVERRATAVGSWGAVAAVASAIGPLLGSALIQWANWRWAFLINLPVGLWAWWWGRNVLDESHDADAGRFPDWLGVLAAVAVVAAFALWIIQGAAFPWSDPRRVASLASVVVLSPFLVWRCARHPSPVIDLGLFRIRSFAVANLATMLFSAAFFSALLAYVLFLTSVWHYAPLAAGLAIAPTPLAAAAAAVPAGLVADRFGHRLVVVPGTAVFAAGVAWLTLRAGTDVAYAAHWLPGSLLMGAGVGMAFPTLASASASSLPPARFAVGSAINVTSRQLGAVVGVAGLVVLLARARAEESGAEAFRGGWIFMALVALAAGLVSLALGKASAHSIER